MKFKAESLIYLIVRAFGFIISRLPMSAALALGRVIGIVGYYISSKHKSIAYSNLKVAFARSKKPSEIKYIVKRLFQNYGQNLVEIFHLPSIHKQGWEKFMKVEGQQHVQEALKQKKGVILLAMHFGSWELSSFMGQVLGHPYKVLAKPQGRYTQLDDLLNSYRQCVGSDVILRGRGTRELVEGLRNNDVIGMVVDQGGKDGTLAKFFGRSASMAIGAIRIGLKLGVPICFSIIVREQGSFHRLIIDAPLPLTKTGDSEKDILANLNKIVKIMEGYITRYPWEYMWFYKIWKYSKEATTVIVSDGKAGHLRQSQAVGAAIENALSQRQIQATTETVEVSFKNRFCEKFFSVFCFLIPARFSQGRLRYLKWFLTKKSFLDLARVKADFVVSCGSAAAGVNFLLSRDYRAKSICILKPGILGFRRFHLVILPHHDKHGSGDLNKNVVYIQGAANLINPEYISGQSGLLLNRYSHLKNRGKTKIGVLLGGNNKNSILTEAQIKILMGQIKSACEQIDAEMLVTTSRRTPSNIESFLQREIKGDARCPMLIIANRDNVPEAVGGILGLSDIIVVSGDSISMVAEAASCGRNTIVFASEKRKSNSLGKDKHDIFVEKLSADGHVVFSAEKNIGHFICDMAKNKIKTKPIDNSRVIFEAVKQVI